MYKLVVIKFSKHILFFCIEIAIFINIVMSQNNIILI